jgi:hypothetical protein
MNIFNPWKTLFSNEKNLQVDAVLQFGYHLNIVLKSGETRYHIESNRRHPYRIMDKSYAYLGAENEEGRNTTTNCSFAEDSVFIKLLSSDPMFSMEHEDNPFKHYVIKTQDEIIDLVSNDAPVVTILTESTENFLCQLLLINENLD